MDLLTITNLAESAETGANAWIIDVVFIGILLFGLIFGVTRGFVRGVCKIAGTIFSLVVAFFFCNQLSASLESQFGLTTMLANAIGSANVAYWIMVVGSFIVLAVIVRLLAWLVGKIGKTLIEKSKALACVDRVLGGILGVAEALIVVLLVLLILKWISFDAVNAYLGQSMIVGKLYFGEWLEWLAAFPARFIAGGKNAIALVQMPWPMR